MTGSQPDQFTKIPNQILEEIINGKFNGTQYKLIMAVCRFTFGFQRDKAELSISFLSEATGLNSRNIRRELDVLMRRSIILEHNEQHGTRARTIGINKDVNQWLEGVNSPPLDDAREGQLTPTNNSREGHIAPTREGELAPSREGQLTPQERKKKTLKKIYSISAHRIFTFWNDQKITVHRDLTDDIGEAIEAALKKHGLENILLAIQRYSKVYYDSDYFFSYKWTLINFLNRKRAVPDFLDGGEKWENYLARGQPNNNKLPVDDLGDLVPGALDQTPI